MMSYPFNKDGIYSLMIAFLCILALLSAGCSSKGNFVPFQERMGIIRDYDLLKKGGDIDWFYASNNAIEPGESLYVPDFVFIGNDDYELYDNELRRINLKKTAGDFVSNALKEKGIFSHVDRQTSSYPSEAKYVLAGAVICLEGCHTQFFVDNPVNENVRFSLEMELIDSDERTTLFTAKHTFSLKSSDHDVILSGLKSAVNRIAGEIARRP